MTVGHLRPRILLSTCLLALAATPALAQDIVQPVAVQAAVPQVLAATAAGSHAPVAAAPTAATAATAHATTATPATPAAESPGRIQTVLKHALALLGTPYRWGGTTTAGFDCSGLVGYVFRTTLGIELPRVSRDMAKAGEQVDRSRMSPGDLVFFGRRGRVDHVGIYLGDGRFVHAPRTGRDVTVSSMEDGYWGRKFLEARRVAGI